MTAGALFTRPDYLEPLERTGCAAPATGWQRLPQLAGPWYAKGHSWGEFVFDFAWAQASERAGLPWYPKLVCAVPFTPVPGPRLGPDPAGSAASAVEFTRTHGLSGAHVLFLPPAEAEALSGSDWLVREQLRFVWRNADYADFDAYLAALDGKKRRNIRQERRGVDGLGLVIEWRKAREIVPADWPMLHALYARTYEVRGQEAYLAVETLQAWAKAFPEQLLFCVARDAAGIPQAMAYFFRDAGALYGRHWGCAAQYAFLHFELCYYQGVEYCIREHLARFDAGVQGEHKLARGFLPERSLSLHWVAHEGLRARIAEALVRERRLVAAAEMDAWSHSPYREAAGFAGNSGHAGPV